MAVTSEVIGAGEIFNGANTFESVVVASVASVEVPTLLYADTENVYEVDGERDVYVFEVPACVVVDTPLSESTYPSAPDTVSHENVTVEVETDEAMRDVGVDGRESTVAETAYSGYTGLPEIELYIALFTDLYPFAYPTVIEEEVALETFNSIVLLSDNNVTEDIVALPSLEVTVKAEEVASDEDPERLLLNAAAVEVAISVSKVILILFVTGLYVTPFEITRGEV